MREERKDRDGLSSLCVIPASLVPSLAGDSKSRETRQLVNSPSPSGAITSLPFLALHYIASLEGRKK